MIIVKFRKFGMLMFSMILSRRSRTVSERFISKPSPFLSSHIPYLAQICSKLRIGQSAMMSSARPIIVLIPVAWHTPEGFTPLITLLSIHITHASRSLFPARAHLRVIQTSLRMLLRSATHSPLLWTRDRT